MIKNHGKKFIKYTNNMVEIAMLMLLLYSEDHTNEMSLIKWRNINVLVFANII